MPPFTAFAVGPDPTTAYEAAAARAAGQGGPLAATNRLVHAGAPAGVEASKLATWVQRRAADGSLDDVPPEHHAAVDDLVAEYAVTGTCIALEVTGDLAGRMRARLGATDPSARTWLLFGSSG